MSPLKELIQSLRRNSVLKSPRLIAALTEVDRKDFVPEAVKEHAYEDHPLAIGEGQTISQPYTVVFMVELLDLKEGDNVLDVGYGSGWQTSLLASLVGVRGHVFAVERVKTICDFGKKNVLKYSDLSRRVDFYCQDATVGLSEEARAILGFDAIIAAAEVNEVPAAWRDQLKIGGRLVYPKDRAVWKEVKKSEKDFEMEMHPGFVFVPFVQV